MHQMINSYSRTTARTECRRPVALLFFLILCAGAIPFSVWAQSPVVTSPAPATAGVPSQPQMQAAPAGPQQPQQQSQPPAPSNGPVPNGAQPQPAFAMPP